MHLLMPLLHKEVEKLPPDFRSSHHACHLQRSILNETAESIEHRRVEHTEVQAKKGPRRSPRSPRSTKFADSTAGSACPPSYRRPSSSRVLCLRCQFSRRCQSSWPPPWCHGRWCPQLFRCLWQCLSQPLSWHVQWPSRLFRPRRQFYRQPSPCLSRYLSRQLWFRGRFFRRPSSRRWPHLEQAQWVLHCTTLQR